LREFVDPNCPEQENFISMLLAQASERSSVQEEWMDGKVPVITATVSFGMGVDKATVR